MRIRLPFLVAGLLLLGSCTSDVDSPNEPKAQESESDSDCGADLDRALRAWETAGFSGSVAISKGGEFECQAGYGRANQQTGEPNTADTVFSIGSITKGVTAASIFQLVDDGALSLTDRAGDLVPGLAGPAADTTVEQLLLHTSGLTGGHGQDEQPLSRDEAVAAISRLESAFAPGTDFLYSNSGYTLLAIIVEHVSGTTYRDLTMSRTLPLPGGDVAGGFWDGEPAAPGPRAVGYLDDGPTSFMGDFEGPHWAVQGNGGVAMTMRDLASWTRALFTGEIVSAASTEAITTPGFDNGDGTSETPGWVMLDEEALGEPAFAAAGGGGEIGHKAVVAWLPESDRTIAMASNTEDISAEELLRAIGPALIAGDDLPTPDPADSKADPDELAALEGTYDVDTGGSFEVTATDDGLAVAAGGPDAIDALFPLPESSGFSPDDVEEHEQLVLDLMAGETKEGREEREAFEESFGPIDDIELEGTIGDGELRTYLAVTTGSEQVHMWFALDEEGGIAAVESPTEPPTLDLVPSGDGFRPDDPTGRGPDVTVTFDRRTLTVTGPTGQTVARSAS
jgi:CubicO group peptidase (beta-lactamase class C family)